ncbi:hypothetical protein Tco_1306708, partial [Tanacetum coccineum]
SEHSTVTYTSISSDYEEPSDVGSLGVVVYRYDGLPMHPPSPDYVPEPEHPPSPDYVPGHPPSPVYVPYVSEPAYLEFMPPEDDVFPAEEQPLPAAVSPTADLPGYITESNPEEDPEEEDNEDPEEDPTDYPADIDDDDEEESSEDDVDNDEKDEGEEEEEERLALADFVPPPQTGTRGARITVQPQPPMAASTKALIVVVAATLPLPSPPPSPLISYSSPLPQIPSPPFLVPSYLLLALLTLRVDVSEVTLPPRKRLCIATGPRYEIRESSSAPTGGFRADYGFVGTLDAEIRRDPDREIGQRMTDFVTTIRQDTYEIYGRLDDAQDDRLLMSGQLNLLCRDRRSHARTARLMEGEARASREA